MAEKEKRLDPLSEQEIYEQFYNLKSVASASELTGLMPALPMSEDSAASYSQLYGTPIPTDLDSKKMKKNNKGIKD